MTEEAPQRTHPLREVFPARRWVVRAGAPWRLLPHDFPPWEAVSQQTQRWLKAGVFEAVVEDRRTLLRMAGGRDGHPSAVVLDSRTLQSTPASGARAGYEGATRRTGSKVHLAVETWGHLLGLRVTAGHEQDREQVAQLAEHIQAVTGDRVEVAFVDQAYTGEATAQAAADHGLRLKVIKLPQAKHGFVLLPRRWVVERSFAWRPACGASPGMMSAWPTPWLDFITASSPS